MEVRNGKRINFKRIYSQICKYSKTIPEIAQEYDMTPEAFTDRLQTGLEPKLFANCVKASERNLKQHGKDNNGSVEEKNKEQHEEEKAMTKLNQEKIPNSRQKQSNTDKATKSQKKQATNKQIPESAMSDLENKKVTLTGEIFMEEKLLDEENQVLRIREETLAETQRIFEEAKQALAESKSERDEAKNAVTQHSQTIENLKKSLADVERQIIDLKNSAIYLVAPGFTGEKPAFGRYFSTTSVDGFNDLVIVKAADEYVIEPELKDMVISGYDSYKEYIEGLRFVMLCVEYTCNDREFKVLVTDERLKKLIKSHVD